jgi:L-ribulose-5-phosphate 4-epimerase
MTKVFTLGSTRDAAVKAAVMVADLTRTICDALQLSRLKEIPPEMVERFHRRYIHVYGQEKWGENNLAGRGE